MHIFGEKTPKIYSLSAMKREGVINDTHEGTDLVIFFQDGMVSILDTKKISEGKTLGSVTVFSSMLEDQKLTFSSEGNNYKDLKTSSVWTLTGKCIEGQLKGKHLKPIVYGNHFAFAWLSFYPETVIYGN